MSDDPPLKFKFCKQIDELVGIENFERMSQVIEGDPAAGEILAEEGDYLIRYQKVSVARRASFFVAYGTSKSHKKIVYLYAARDEKKLKASFEAKSSTARRYIARIFKRIAIVLVVGIGKKLMDDGLG